MKALTLLLPKVAAEFCNTLPEVQTERKNNKSKARHVLSRRNIISVTDFSNPFQFGLVVIIHTTLQILLSITSFFFAILNHYSEIWIWKIWIWKTWPSHQKQFEFDMRGSCNSDSPGLRLQSYTAENFLMRVLIIFWFQFSVEESGFDPYLHFRLDLWNYIPMEICHFSRRKCKHIHNSNNNNTIKISVNWD